MNTIINAIAVFISLFTATGVFVHEARVDRVTATSAAIRTGALKKAPVKTNPNAAPSDANISADPHIHPDHGARTLRGFSYKSPTAPPRAQKMKRYLMQNIEPRGRHAFDNYNLPLVA